MGSHAGGQTGDQIGGYARILLELPITQCDAIWLSLMPIADSTRARPALARRLAARQV